MAGKIVGSRRRNYDSGIGSSPVSYSRRGSLASRAASAAVNVASSIPGPVGSVARAGKLAYGAYKFVKRFQKSRQTQTRKSSPSKYFTQGGYQGKFKKGKKLETKGTIYANKGILHTHEVSGTVSDPDCVYITHCAVDSYEVVEVAVQALMRKLFQRGGFNITNIDEVLVGTSISNAADWQVQLTNMNGKTGAETVNVSYTTVAASTIRSVAAQFYVQFMLFSSGATTTPGLGDASNDLRPWRLILYRQDYNVTYSPVFECALNLEDEMICLYGCSEMKIQNRTLSANNSADADSVSNNPLIGRSYQFKGMPKCRDRSAYPLNSIPVNNGVQLVRAASLTGNTGFKEPPNPSVFTNCKTSAKIRLEPGAIKSSKLMFVKNMKFLTFLQKLRLQYGTGTEFLGYLSMFPCETFAFEDIINVDTSQKISCAYEANQTYGIYFKTKKKSTGVVSFAETVYSSNAA